MMRKNNVRRLQTADYHPRFVNYFSISRAVRAMGQKDRAGSSGQVVSCFPLQSGQFGQGGQGGLALSQGSLAERGVNTFCEDLGRNKPK